MSGLTLVPDHTDVAPASKHSDWVLPQQGHLSMALLPLQTSRRAERVVRAATAVLATLLKHRRPV